MGGGVMTYIQAPNACDECGQDVTDTDAAPTCGAHRLHQGCAAWFRPCRDCAQIWDDLEWRPDVSDSVARLSIRVPLDPHRLEPEEDPWSDLAAESRARTDRFWGGWKGRAPGHKDTA